MKKMSGKQIVSLVCDAAIVISTVVCVVINFFDIAFTQFGYFTIDSNILMAVCAGLHLGFLLRTVRKGIPVPAWVPVLRFCGTAAVSLTFLVTALFLTQSLGVAYCFTGTNFFLHLINPLLAIGSFVALEPFPGKIPYVFCSMVPMCLYCVVYVIQVVFRGEANGGWPDFYGFYQIPQWWLIVLLFLAVTFVIGILLYFGNRIANRQNKEPS